MANKIGTGIAVIGILMFVTCMFSGFPKQTGMPGVCGLVAGGVMGLGFAILYGRFTLRFFLILTLICGASATLTELSARFGWYGPRIIMRYSLAPRKTSEARPDPPSSKARTYRLVIRYNKSGSGWVAEEFEPAALSLVEAKLQSLDWTNYPLNPTFELHASDGETLEFSGLLNVEKESRKMVAKWQRLRGGKDDGLQRSRSRPLESVDEALALVRAFISRDGKLESLVEWE
jgi:hypothetical protein